MKKNHAEMFKFSDYTRHTWPTVQEINLIVTMSLSSSQSTSSTDHDACLKNYYNKIQNPHVTLLKSLPGQNEKKMSRVCFLVQCYVTKLSAKFKLCNL